MLFPAPRSRPVGKLAWSVLGLWLIVSIFLVACALHLRRGLRQEVRTRMIGRAAAVLQPMVQNQVDVALAGAPQTSQNLRMIEALVANARQSGLLALAIFDAGGATLEAVPSGRSFVELPVEDCFQLVSGSTISRSESSVRTRPVARVT